MSTRQQIVIELPEWHASWIDSAPRFFATREDRVKFVVASALKNIEERTGGPFAAAVVEKESGKLISLGVNRVVSSNCSAAHAEIVAISLAQQMLSSFDLGAPGLHAHELVVSAEPCAMCFGSIPWSGVRSLVTSCTAKEVELITGFDEGPVHPQWKSELLKRGIEVASGVLAQEGLEVLKSYQRSGMPIYNGRGSKK